MKTVDSLSFIIFVLSFPHRFNQMVVDTIITKGGVKHPVFYIGTGLLLHFYLVSLISFLFKQCWQNKNRQILHLYLNALWKKILWGSYGENMVNLITRMFRVVGSMEALSKAFLLFFLLPDWLKFNHLKSWMECGFSDIFSRHICSSVAETIGVTNYAASFGAKKCSENHIWSCWDDAQSLNQQSVEIVWRQWGD